MAKVGLYAGTFDPVHNGHVAFALAAQEACGLGTVVFLPEPHPRGKQNVTDITKRVAMLRLVAATHACLRVQALPDAQFTVARTLPRLQQLFGTDLTLLVGSDIAQYIPQWDGAGELFDAVDIAIGQRAGDPQPVLPVKATVIPTMHAHVAASRIRSGESQDIAPEVRDFIRNNHLYSV